MSIPGFEHIKGLTPRAFKHYNYFIITLKEHHWRSDPVTSKRIEKALGITGPEVRALRLLAWEKGDPVGTCAKGYFWSTKSEEMYKVWEHIKARKEALIRDEILVKKIMHKQLNEEQGSLL